MKRAALSAARCFCLPSYSEGFSVAVLEALSFGVPSVVTPACNIGEVAEFGAGTVTANQPEELGTALSGLLGLPEVKWQEMSANAVKLARERYDWAVIAQAMRDVYTWVLGGPKPACVID